MKTIPLLFSCALYLQLSAQTSLPYYTGFDNANQKAGWTEYRLGDQGAYRWAYESFNPYSAPEVLTHYYPVGGSQLTENWFVSPAFDFSGGGRIDSLRYAFSGFGNVRAGDTVALYLLQDAQHPDSAASQTLLLDFRDSLYQNDNVWRKLENLPIPASSGTSYLAFRYVTVNNWLDVRFDNLALSGNGIGIDEKPRRAEISLFPNPTQGQIRLAGIDSGEIKLYDSSGKCVLQKWVSKDEKLDINGLSGLLFYTISDDKKALVASGKLLAQSL